MLKIQTIESDIYEKTDDSIFVKHIGMKTGQEVFDLLYTHLEQCNLLPDEYFLLSHDPAMQRELPDFHTAICSTDWGGSEGIYMDISLLYSEDRERKLLHFATGKTLDRSGDAFLKMSRIAGECSMMLNGRGSIVRISEKAYEKVDSPMVIKPRLDDQIQTAMSEPVVSNVGDKNMEEPMR